MKTINELIRRFGGLKKLRQGQDYIRIENPPFMRLVIEWIGPGESPGSDVISVAHYYDQNGDAMRDPEVTFEVVVTPDGLTFKALTFQQDNLGIYREIHTEAERRDVEEFCKMWDQNIRDQGFVEAHSNTL